MFSQEHKFSISLLLSDIGGAISNVLKVCGVDIWFNHCRAAWDACFPYQNLWIPVLGVLNPTSCSCTPWETEDDH